MRSSTLRFRLAVCAGLPLCAAALSATLLLWARGRAASDDAFARSGEALAAAIAAQNATPLASADADAMRPVADWVRALPDVTAVRFVDPQGRILLGDAGGRSGAVTFRAGAPGGGSVEIEVLEASRLASRERLARDVFLVTLAASLFAALGIALLFRLVARPLDRMAAEAARLAANPESGAGALPKELGLVSESLSILLNALAAARASALERETAATDQVRSRMADLDAATAQLEAQRSRMIDAARVGQLVSKIAHELNNPLATVCGHVERLESQASLPADVRSRLAIVHTQAERCHRTIRDLLVYARMVKPQLAAVSLNHLVGETIDAHRMSLSEWGIEPEVSLDPEAPIVFCDRGMLEQVVVNLITNARNALNSLAGVKTLQIKTRITGSDAQLVVMDNGPGIPRAIKDSLFDPFAPREGAGGGLGLSFCSGIIEEHHGRIQAFNRPGGGASLVVSLPLHHADTGKDRPMPDRTTSPPSPRRAATGTAVATAPLRVLVVDDEPEIASLIEEALTDEGHQVVKALNGSRAIDALQTGEFDLIVSDMRMPGMSGRELHEQVRSRWPDLADRLVFITGDQSGGDIAQFLEQSKARCIGKPFRVSELQELASGYTRRG